MTGAESYRCACPCSCPYITPVGLLTCDRCRAGDHTRAQPDPLDAFQRELIGVIASVREALLKQEATAREMLEFMKERYGK